MDDDHGKKSSSNGIRFSLKNWLKMILSYTCNTYSLAEEKAKKF